MQAPFFHNVRLGAAPQTRLHLLGQRLLLLIEFLPGLWRALKVFYGVGAIGAAVLAMAFFVQLEGETGHAAASKQMTSPESKDVVLAAPTSQVVYVVSSRQQADNLLAFGPPSGGPGQLLPFARVSVMVTDSPASDLWTRVAMERVMAAHLNNEGSPTVQIVDLR